MHAAATVEHCCTACACESVPKASLTVTQACRCLQVDTTGLQRTPGTCLLAYFDPKAFCICTMLPWQLLHDCKMTNDDLRCVHVIGGFGTVFVDQSYWQSAIAAKPSASWKGYLLGGLMWFSIPFALATSLGLSVVALDLPLTIDEGNLGLVPPAAALAILGNGGAILVVMACFSEGCLYQP